ncbi:diguanylate cyclase domain-containing protein [uncultured Desulfobulbus sp.]|uniref:diguanylate cyclase domain-containing protein n=1 Tax=uncultured Desulfobulbus sp. TaxID=239745 RepID=UPI00374D028D
MCCRYGGEDFAVILPENFEASKIADRMKTKMAQRLSDGHTVTVSLGVSFMRDNDPDASSPRGESRRCALSSQRKRKKPG